MPHNLTFYRVYLNRPKLAAIQAVYLIARDEDLALLLIDGFNPLD